jgi:hypothetical protein
MYLPIKNIFGNIYICQCTVPNNSAHSYCEKLKRRGNLKARFLLPLWRDRNDKCQVNIGTGHQEVSKISLKRRVTDGN